MFTNLIPQLEQRKLLNSCDGTSAMYVLLALPVALILSALAVDLTSWQELGAELQGEADRLALSAAKALPDTARAESYVVQAANTLNVESVKVSPRSIDGSVAAIDVELSSSFKPLFASILGAGDSLPKLNIKRVASAQVVPSDVVFIISDAASLRPGLVASATELTGVTYETPWGQAEPASYFRCVKPAEVSGVPAGVFDWVNAWNSGDEGFYRWATEACFNPVLNPLKFASMAAVSAVQSFSGNRVGVIFSPGDNLGAGYSFLRRVHSSAGEFGGGFVPAGYLSGDGSNKSEAAWNINGSRSFELPFDNNSCVAFSNVSFGDGGDYNLPDAALWEDVSGIDGSCTSPLTAICGGTHAPEKIIDKCYFQKNLSLSEAIYWHAAKRAGAFSTAKFDIERSLSAAINELRSDSSSLEESSLRRRGAMSQSSHRWVVILSDNLGSPTAAKFSEFERSFNSMGIRLLIVAYEHERLSEVAKIELNNASRAWQEIAAVQRVISVSSGDELVRSAESLLAEMRVVVRKS